MFNVQASGTIKDDDLAYLKNNARNFGSHIARKL